MPTENPLQSIGLSKRTVEWQPGLFDGIGHSLVRMEIEDLKQSNSKMRKALFARDDHLQKEIETLNGVIGDLTEAYLELLRRLDDKNNYHSAMIDEGIRTCKV